MGFDAACNPGPGSTLFLRPPGDQLLRNVAQGFSRRSGFWAMLRMLPFLEGADMY